MHSGGWDSSIVLQCQLTGDIKKLVAQYLVLTIE